MAADRKYYQAYDRRYRQVHAQGLQWASSIPTPILGEAVRRYGLGRGTAMLEIGCGEGRDAFAMLAQGYDLQATDVSGQAVAYCRRQHPEWAERFWQLDCLKDDPPGRYGFIYAIAVIHMLVPDDDRAAFYAFIRRHLAPQGCALICSMGDGRRTAASDVTTAFDDQRRVHQGTGRAMELAATSCRMVTMAQWRQEIAAAGLQVLESGLTECHPDFSSLMYAVIADR